MAEQKEQSLDPQIRMLARRMGLSLVSNKNRDRLASSFYIPKEFNKIGVLTHLNYVTKPLTYSSMLKKKDNHLIASLFCVK